MPPTALMFVVCHALANQGPLDVNGFPIDGVKLDHSTCRNELVQMYDRLASDGPNPVPNFSNPTVCSRMALTETPNWEAAHRGWYVLKVKCPHPDGTSRAISTSNPGTAAQIDANSSTYGVKLLGYDLLCDYRVGIGFSPR